MIELKDVRKSFGKNEVLKGINLQIDKGEVVVIIGPSGSGKSTVLRTMNYLEEPTSGHVIVDGMDLSDKNKLNAVRTEVGMVFQNFNLFPHMTVLDNLTLAPVNVRKMDKKEAFSKFMNGLSGVIEDVIEDEFKKEENYTEMTTTVSVRKVNNTWHIKNLDEQIKAVDMLFSSLVNSM